MGSLRLSRQSIVMNVLQPYAGLETVKIDILSLESIRMLLTLLMTQIEKHCMILDFNLNSCCFKLITSESNSNFIYALRSPNKSL